MHCEKILRCNLIWKEIPLREEFKEFDVHKENKFIGNINLTINAF